MATSWLKARTPLLASRLFLGCAFAGTESSDMSDTIKDRVLHGETPRASADHERQAALRKKAPAIGRRG